MQCYITCWLIWLSAINKLIPYHKLKLIMWGIIWLLVVTFAVYVHLLFNVHTYSLYCNLHYMFRHNWPYFDVCYTSCVYQLSQLQKFNGALLSHKVSNFPLLGQEGIKRKDDQIKFSRQYPYSTNYRYLCI